ncbi:MAG TPA: DUF1697 domain-containing protein [Polyangia bacterium]|jgi:uncharacterized protein (DUF1697 family)|nr:DUF1697 domain-containing protein [Polyangia bacterium]
MPMTSKGFVALLRGINVGGNKRVPMAELRALAEGLGWRQVATFIQSGNLVFVSDGSSAALEADLERELARHFGFPVEVIVRGAAAWRRYAAGTPFSDAQEARPQRVLLGLSKRPPTPDAAERLKGYCKAGERIELADDAIWIDFAAGIGKSKLSPAVLDRAVGSTVTARNWTTVQALATLLDAPPAAPVAKPRASRR